MNTTPVCADCPAQFNAGVAQGLRGPVTVVLVTHASTCPWFRRVASSLGREDALEVVTSAGLVVHVTDGVG